MKIENTPSQWWRWPLLPFASICGALVGTIFIGILQWLGMKFSGGYSEDGWYYLYVLPIFMSGIFGYFWVVSACYVAPKGKKNAGIVMATVLGILLLATIVFSLANSEYSAGQKIQSILGGISMVCSSVYAIITSEE